MDNLPTASLLILKGWTWVTNCSRLEAQNAMTGMRDQQKHVDFCMGEPQSHSASIERLISMGIVGLYRKDGGKPVKSTFNVPSLPSFSKTITKEKPKQRLYSRVNADEKMAMCK